MGSRQAAHLQLDQATSVGMPGLPQGCPSTLMPALCRVKRQAWPSMCPAAAPPVLTAQDSSALPLPSQGISHATDAYKGLQALAANLLLRPPQPPQLLAEEAATGLLGKGLQVRSWPVPAPCMQPLAKPCPIPCAAILPAAVCTGQQRTTATLAVRNAASTLP